MFKNLVSNFTQVIVLLFAIHILFPKLLMEVIQKEDILRTLILKHKQIRDTKFICLKGSKQLN